MSCYVIRQEPNPSSKIQRRDLSKGYFKEGRGLGGALIQSEV